VWSKVSYCQWVRNTTQRLTPTIIIDWQVYRAARMPGPHDYEAIPLKNYKEAEPRHILGTKGPKTDLDHAFGIPVAKTIPGPGAYGARMHSCLSRSYQFINKAIAGIG
jgi:hypothetical protein